MATENQRMKEMKKEQGEFFISRLKEWVHIPGKTRSVSYNLRNTVTTRNHLSNCLKKLTKYPCLLQLTIEGNNDRR
jgi:hypothetical protein